MPSRTPPVSTIRALAVLACVCLIALPGCSRRFWRQQAERDTYEAVFDKLNDPHWAVPRVDLKPDARSRFYDPFDPDCEPLPPDDPAAHESMHCVSGRRGYKNWHKLGTALSIENPQWLAPFGILMDNADPVHGHNRVSLEEVTLRQAVELSYIHRREYQTVIEDVYLTALAVTEEQFNLGVRYAGPGVRVPGFTGALTDNPAGDNTVSFNPRFGVSQLLPAGGQIAVELANNTLWLFGGGTSNSASSLAFSLTQPLLFRAGRKVVLEALTQAERNVLYSVRDLARFRQEQFTLTTTDFLNIQLQLQAIRNLEGNIRRLEDQLEVTRATDAKQPYNIRWELSELPEDAVIPESLAGLLSYDKLTGTLNWSGPMTDEQRAEILAVSDNPGYRAAAEQLVRSRTQQTINLPSAELLSRLKGQQSQLQDFRRLLADSIDDFKIELGLPPDIGMSLDDSILDQFTLIDPVLLEIDNELRDLAELRGPDVLLEIDSEIETFSVDMLPGIRVYLQELNDLRISMAAELNNVGSEFEPVDELLAAADPDNAGEDSATGSAVGQREINNEEERQRVVADVDRDRKLFQLTEQDFLRAARLLDMLLETTADENFPSSLDTDGDGLISADEFPEPWPAIQKDGERDGLPRTLEAAIGEARNGMLELREEFVALLQSMQVVQADLRVEQIAVNKFVLPGGTETPTIEEVVRIGLSRRHDLMNQRAFVMDARRVLEVAANELEATLDVTFSGVVGTNPAGSRKPFNFSGTGARYDAGLALDTPADKIAERNTYNAALIEYQRTRRDYMAAEDEVKRQIRESWRELQVAAQRLEIDREAVRVAGLQLDIAASGSGQDNALSLLNALDAVLQAQNSLVTNWVRYELSRLNIYRDMGIMQIDQQGMWIDRYYVDTVEFDELTALDPELTALDPDLTVPEVDDELTQLADLPDPPLLPAANPLPPEAAIPVFDFEDDAGDGEQE